LSVSFQKKDLASFADQYGSFHRNFGVPAHGDERQYSALISPGPLNPMAGRCRFDAESETS